MKAFSGPATSTVTLTHGAETTTFTLTARPAGYAAYLERVYPQPSELVNGVRTPLASAAFDWRYDQNVLNIGKALGDQVDAVAPSSSNGAEWAKYAAALRAEFTAAGLNDQDLNALVAGVMECERGSGEPGKSS